MQKMTNRILFKYDSVRNVHRYDFSKRLYTVTLASNNISAALICLFDGDTYSDNGCFSLIADLKECVKRASLCQKIVYYKKLVRLIQKTLADYGILHILFGK